ncbi:hypothetical protein AcetOrient_orf02056 [Acetobacter orientalis]|uniref:Uncharacterized protein n=1 Tax=Acetobacter orientalis TaxID=146474 RepID=A0A2Z5ZHX0_9PROT|nr:hypothetical protein AcetOrient_orf02056 [Acetobacter orientalis]
MNSWCVAPVPLYLAAPHHKGGYIYGPAHALGCASAVTVTA